MERTPPLWPALYPSASSSLQHAQELHLLSQQQLLRQQELLMIQQQAAQVMELQRSAQLAVSELPHPNPPAVSRARDPVRLHREAFIEKYKQYGAEVLGSCYGGRRTRIAV